MGADLGKDDDGIHAGERSDDGGPLLLRDKRAPRTFEFSDRAVAIQPDDKEVAEPASALEIGDVAKVHQVETPIRGDNALAAAAGQCGPAAGLRQR